MWDDVHIAMLASRARAVRRRILELRASWPSIGSDVLEHYDSGIIERLDRTERRMLELAERLERGSVRSERALELADRLATRAARLAELATEPAELETTLGEAPR